MLSFIAQRLFQSLLVMLTVALIAFAMFRYVATPGHHGGPGHHGATT